MHAYPATLWIVNALIKILGSVLTIRPIFMLQWQDAMARCNRYVRTDWTIFSQTMMVWTKIINKRTAYTTLFSPSQLNAMLPLRNKPYETLLPTYQTGRSSPCSCLCQYHAQRKECGKINGPCPQSSSCADLYVHNCSNIKAVHSLNQHMLLHHWGQLIPSTISLVHTL